MDTFGKQVTISVNKMLGGMNKAIQETAVELYASAVVETPIKAGDAINSWGVSINTADGARSLSVLTNNEKESVAQQVATVIAGTKLSDNYYLKNSISYILLLENGGYDGIPLHERDPYPPWYPESQYPRPFTLLVAGANGPISKKAPLGMVKVTMLAADRVFNEMWAKYGE